MECYNEIEANLKAGQPLEVIRATGAKMADNMARIAGVLAVVDGAASITQRHMASAIQLGQFYLSEQLRLAQRSELESIAQQAQEAADWIKAKGGGATIEELQKGPRSVRKSVDHIRDVMALLVEHGRCTITACNGSNKPSAWRLTDV